MTELNTAVRRRRSIKPAKTDVSEDEAKTGFFAQVDAEQDRLSQTLDSISVVVNRLMGNTFSSSYSDCETGPSCKAESSAAAHRVLDDLAANNNLAADILTRIREFENLL